jgi:serine/threonine-protein kinase
VHYIAPEQARGEHTDARADIYGVGVMLFEMLTGKLPFEADSPVSVALKQIQLEAVRPTSINPGIPEGLEEITMKAMQKDIVRRYQSAAEMLKDIDLFKNDPTMHFEYQYLSPDSEAESRKYRRAISASRENKRGDGQTSGNRERKDLRKPTGRAARPPRQNDDQHESVIPRWPGSRRPLCWWRWRLSPRWCGSTPLRPGCRCQGAKSCGRYVRRREKLTRIQGFCH